MKETEEEVLRKRDNDEIDLSPLFKKLDKVINKASRTTSRFWKIIRLRSYIIAVFILVGIGVGVLLYTTAKPVYNSSVTLTSSILPLEFCKDIVDNLNTLAAENNHDLLSKKLNISTSAASDIVGFEFIYLHPYLDSIVKGHPFRVEVEVYDNAVLNDVQQGMVALLENNNYTKERRERGIAKLQLLRDKLDLELKQMDSLKQAIAQSIIPRGSGSGLIYGEPLDPVNVYKEIINLYERKLTVENELSFMNSIHVVNDFLPRGNPDSPVLLKNILYGAIIGLILGIFIVLLIPVKKLEL